MSQQGYIGRNPGDGRTIVNRQTTHVTTGVQTSFTMTVGYEVGYLDVYLNGIKQTETLDYTASDGSTINFALSFPPVNGDVLEFVAFETLNITNIKSARRNFSVGQDLDVSGNVTIGSSLTVASDLVVNGTFTTINTEILDVEDKTVGIASTSSPSNTTADGAGIVIYGGSDGDKSLTWNSTKSNFVLVGGGVSIGTGVTISTPAANVLAFSVNSAEKARFNNFGAFTVGYEGEAWHESTYVGVLQAGSGAWIGQTPGASARAEWTNNAYYDSVNTRWEYIAADEANRIVLENGELKVQSADAGSADGAITWNEKLKMTVGGDFKIGAPTGIGITISSSGNVDSIGIITATSYYGDGSNLSNITSTTINSNADDRIITGSGTANTLNGESNLTFDGTTILKQQFTATNTYAANNTTQCGYQAHNLSDTTDTYAAIRLTAGSSSPATAQIASVRRGTGSNDLTFQVEASNTAKEAMRITSAGLMGLGTATPASLLEMKGASPRITLTDTNGTDDVGKIFSYAGALMLQQRDGNSHGEIIFRTENNSTATERMRITSGGDVRLNGGALVGDDTALPTFTIKNTDGNSNNCKITLGESIGADNGGITFYTAGSSSSTARMRIRGNNNFIDILSSYTLRFNDGKLNITHDGSHGYVTATTGILHLRSDESIRIQDESGNPMLYAIDGGAVELYHNGTKMLSTESRGAILQKADSCTFTIGSTNSGSAQIFLDGDSDGDSGGGDYSGLRHRTDGHFEIFADNPSANADLYFKTGNSTHRWTMNSSGVFYPATNNTYDIGTSTHRVRNIYTNDLNLSNKGSQNDVDGTWGDYTIQEGESDLFLINKRSGKKFKFMLQEVS